MKRVLIFLILLMMPFSVYAEKDTVTFSECVDGDTMKVLLNKKEVKVRFLAVDTPESVHPTKGVEPYGKEASEYTCNKLKKAKKIELEYDSNSSKTDKYGRYLAWVFIDGKLFQKELVSKGYAKVAYLYGDYKYTDELKKLQETAKSKKLKIWSDESESNDEDTSSTSTSTTTKTTSKKKSSSSSSKKDKDIIDIIIDSIIDFIKDIFNKIIKYIEKVLKNML